MRCRSGVACGDPRTTRSRERGELVRKPYRWGANLPAAVPGVKAPALCPVLLATPRPRATPAVAASIPAPGASSPWRAARYPACAGAIRPVPRAAAGCGGARPGAWGSRALDPQGALLRPAGLLRAGAQRGRQTLLGQIALDQPHTVGVARPPPPHPAPAEPGRPAEAPREGAQPEA